MSKEHKPHPGLAKSSKNPRNSMAMGRRGGNWRSMSREELGFLNPQPWTDTGDFNGDPLGPFCIIGLT